MHPNTSPFYKNYLLKEYPFLSEEDIVEEVEVEQTISIPKIDETTLPIVGEVYLVPCVIFRDKMELTPVYNHPHDDKENGQPEKHYHADTRFTYEQFSHHDNEVINIEGEEFKLNPYEIRIEEHRTDGETKHEIKYIPLELIRLGESYKTSTKLLSKSTIPHVCKNINSCPHRGFDLSGIPFDHNGIRTCPLHGLHIHKSGRTSINYLDLTRFELDLREPLNIIAARYSPAYNGSLALNEQGELMTKNKS